MTTKASNAEPPIGGATRTAAVIGHPVRHSLSPAIHNAAFAAAGIDWVYVALDVAPGYGEQAVAAMRVLEMAGMSVTMPHKAAVAAAADARTVAVDRLGAANCLFWSDGQIVADSTDGDGFVAGYEHRFERSLAGQTVAVFGAGGAAKSIIEALGRHEVDSILVYNRSAGPLAAAVELAEQAREADIDELKAADVIVNASSVGMHGGPAPNATPFDINLIHDRHAVVDIVYNPVRTPLLVGAEARGATTEGGVSMLVHQAALAFRRWTNQAAPLDAMLGAVADQLH